MEPCLPTLSLFAVKVWLLRLAVIEVTSIKVLVVYIFDNLVMQKKFIRLT